MSIKFKINANIIKDKHLLDTLLKDSARLANEARLNGDESMREVYKNLYCTLSDAYCLLLTDDSESVQVSK